jgi:aminotransferase
VGGLLEAGFEVFPPSGAYYVMADFSVLSDLDAPEFAVWLTEKVGVAPVPGTSFYSNREDGRSLVRFNFAKRVETLEEACRRLEKVRRASGAR